MPEIEIVAYREDAIHPGEPVEKGVAHLIVLGKRRATTTARTAQDAKIAMLDWVIDAMERWSPDEDA